MYRLDRVFGMGNSAKEHIYAYCEMAATANALCVALSVGMNWQCHFHFLGLTNPGDIETNEKILKRNEEDYPFFKRM